MKKKTIAAFGFFAVSVALVLIYTSAPANAQLLDQNFSINTLASHLKNPQDVALYMWRHFNYEGDQRQFGQEDYWQSAAEIFQTKKGDCEDFAIFAKQILEINGYRAFILNLHGTKDHSICIFKQGGKYGAVDGGQFIAADFENLQSLISYIDRFWTKAAIVEADSWHAGRVLANIFNPKKPSKKFFLFG